MLLITALAGSRSLLGSMAARSTTFPDIAVACGCESTSCLLGLIQGASGTLHDANTVSDRSTGSVDSIAPPAADRARSALGGHRQVTASLVRSRFMAIPGRRLALHPTAPFDRRGLPCGTGPGLGPLRCQGSRLLRRLFLFGDECLVQTSSLRFRALSALSPSRRAPRRLVPLPRGPGFRGRAPAARRRGQVHSSVRFTFLAGVCLRQPDALSRLLRRGRWPRSSASATPLPSIRARQRLPLEQRRIRRRPGVRHAPLHRLGQLARGAALLGPRRQHAQDERVELRIHPGVELPRRRRPRRPEPALPSFMSGRVKGGYVSVTSR